MNNKIAIDEILGIKFGIYLSFIFIMYQIFKEKIQLLLKQFSDDIPSNH